MTSPCRTGVAATSTIRAPKRASSIPSIAARRDAWGAEEVVLDLNALAEGHSFLSLGVYTVSDDGNLLAYSLDYTGFREYTLFVKDLRTAALLPDRVEKVSSVAWAADPAVVFYVTEDHAKRPYRLLRHRLGAKPLQDALLYEETDELFRLGVWRSRSKAFIFAGSESITSTESRYLSAGGPDGDLAKSSPRARRITSTTWTTAATSSTSAPTAAAATSAW